MTAIVESIEIARRPEEVFSYMTDFSHFHEWHAGVVSARLEGGRSPSARKPRCLGGSVVAS
jgi:uncharacterized protein YndB with AHSA1/START domain